MTKRIFKFFAIILTASIMFSACQKEQILPEQQNQGKRIYAGRTYDVSKSLGGIDPLVEPKGATIVKYDFVYILQDDGVTLKRHRTLKIRNLAWTIAQEWLLDDLQTNLYQDFSFYPGDTDGSLHGYYYLWNQMKDAADANDWQYIVFRDANWTPIDGQQFHLPKINTVVGTNDGDIEKLASMLGSTSLIPQKLQLSYDGVANTVPPFNTRYANMWIEVRGTFYQPNIVPGCGVYGEWDSQANNSYCLFFTNMSNIKANVRIVRNINSTQW
jgi:hypothetical protein